MREDLESIVITLNMEVNPYITSIYSLYHMGDVETCNIDDDIIRSHIRYMNQNIDNRTIQTIVPITPKSNYVKVILTTLKKDINTVKIMLIENIDKIIESMKNIPEFKHAVETGETLNIADGKQFIGELQATNNKESQIEFNDYHFIGVAEDGWTIIKTPEELSAFNIEWSTISCTLNPEKLKSWYLQYRRPNISAVVVLKKNVKYNYSQIAVMCQKVSNTIHKTLHDMRITQEEIADAIKLIFEKTDILHTSKGTNKYIALFSDCDTEYMIGESEIDPKFGYPMQDGINVQDMMSYLHTYPSKEIMLHVSYVNLVREMVEPELVIVGELKRLIDSSEIDNMFDLMSNALQKHGASIELTADIIEDAKRLFDYI